MKVAKGNSRRLPEALTEPLLAFVDDQEEVEDLLELSTTAIAQLRLMPQTLKVLEGVARKKAPLAERRRQNAQARRLAGLAHQEAERQFPLLYSQALIALWSALEVLVRDLVIAKIQVSPEVLRAEPFAKLKVRLGEYLSLDEDERGQLIVELLEQDLQARLKPGIGRFEPLLQAIGIGGGTAESIRRQLFELSQVRNVLVHRRGVADRKFVSQCGTLAVPVGKRVTVSPELYARCHAAAMAYVMTLILRLTKQAGGRENRALAAHVRSAEQWLHTPIQRGT